MIAGDMKNLEAYKKQLPSFIYEVFEALRKFDFSAVSDGKYEILGCQMNLESPVTEPAADRKPEGHKKMIDVVYEVEGEEEWIGVKPMIFAGPCTESHPDRDLYFFEKGEGEESRVFLRKGSIAVFFPEDLHRPLCQGTSGAKQLRKAVVKVPVEKVDQK